MNICFISDEFPSETGWGGIASCFYNQVRALDKLGHRVIVISRALKNTSCYKIPGSNIEVYRITNNINQKGFRFIYYRFPFSVVRNLLHKHLPEFMDTLEWNLMAFLKFLKISKEIKFDIIQTPEYHFSGVFISIFVNIPIVIYLNGTKDKTTSVRNNSYDLKILSLAEKFYISRHLNNLIANSKETAYFIKKWLNIKHQIKVIYPFIFTDDFLHLKNKNIKSKFILFAGRIEFRKGPDILLKTFFNISSKYPSVKLIFIGHDEKSFYYPDGFMTFKKLLLKLDAPEIVKNRVLILNRMKFEYLKSYYEKCLIAVFPSRYEPFGMVVIEAMASGKPVIASNNGGGKEIIQNNYNGLIIKPNIVQLSKALELLLLNRTLRNKLGNMATKTVKEKFNDEHVVELIKFYKKCIYQ